MDNPFLKRATEYYREDEAFLAIVSPEPVRYFLGEKGRQGDLYDRLVIIRGTPGSGKTTLARLFEFSSVSALLRNRNLPTYRDLFAVLTECGVIEDDQPAVLGYRLPLETGYRDFWEFPYSEELKLGLLTALVQARAVLGWARNLAGAGADVPRAEILPRPDAMASLDAIGGPRVSAVVERARAVEVSLYAIVNSLVPPDISELEETVTSAYRPFDVIERLRIPPDPGNREQALELRPLVILDDAHVLHPEQFRQLQHWLVRREVRVGRWVLTRLDVLHPGEALAAVREDRPHRPQLPGITKSRDTTEILLQSGARDRRTQQRRAFRAMARDMSKRYLRQMPLFTQHNLGSLADLLPNISEPIAPSKRADLEAKVTRARRELHVSDSRYQSIRSMVDDYLSGKDAAPDIHLAMVRILMHRYSRRTSSQRGLFDRDGDLEPPKPLKADSSVYEAARIHLLHEYDRPYYYGMDDLCDASSENAEQFLRSAAILVEAAAVKLARAKSPSLSAREQNSRLRSNAGKVLDDWSFPLCQMVSHLTDAMAKECLAVSLEPNASLGAGANAFGIPQDEFAELPERAPDLARVLQFAIAYNALSVVPRYPCKNREWCLLELGGLVILRHGLTLKRGGFIESSASKLARIMARLGHE